MSNFLFEGPDWSFDLLNKVDNELEPLCKKYSLDIYPNQIEIVSAEQMLDNYSSVGLPLGYHHWSFGKEFISLEKQYRMGHMGLAYELVINSNPCINYLMEENTMGMQTLVLLHAGLGHNSFFKNNYLFKTWTDAASIIDYLVFAKNYIIQCEESYGKLEVELLLDSCHALMNYGVDKYKHPKKLSMEKERTLQKEREAFLQSQVNELWDSIPKKEKTSCDRVFPESPEENILYFIEKNAPNLESWQREIIRIVRKIAQYFYPQRQTKLANEGWATFWHHTLLYDLYDQGKLTDGTMLEVLMSHSGVISQRPMHPINPYSLGFAMFTDIKRICENPTIEDKKDFPDIANSNWIETLNYIMKNYRDESFVSQFLSPKVIRDQKLFSIMDHDVMDQYLVTAIHNDEGYKTVRNLLSDQYNQTGPNIQVHRVLRMTDRTLILRHYRERGRPLNNNTEEVLKHVNRLWGFPVKLETVNEDGILETK